MDDVFPYLQKGSLFLEILNDPFSRKLFGHGPTVDEEHGSSPFTTSFTTRLAFLRRNSANHSSLLQLGNVFLAVFLQANVTGPPLDFSPQHTLFPHVSEAGLSTERKHMITSLSVQGDTIYALTPHIELFWVAKTILSDDELCRGSDGRRARLRINHWHQKLLLSNANDHLRDQIYRDADVLGQQLGSRSVNHGPTARRQYIEFLVEKAVIDIHYGNDVQARKCLSAASKLRGFEFALTGVLGKRTRFQQDDLSQLVVLARSGDKVDQSSPTELDPATSQPIGQNSLVSRAGKVDEGMIADTEAKGSGQPENIPLKDDTLLESIRFASSRGLPEVVSETTELPLALAALDPSSQPLLHPLDSIILLQVASSISNTSPSDGLTREETMPYATRVLEGGSSNWQVYTQALLVRSRIEGYRSRTAERGLLQLQALVDQVIVDTSPEKHSDGDAAAHHDDRLPSQGSQPTTFLPTTRPGESAPVAERLRYVYQLYPPLRWELEAELAARWVSMGGLKTALEIYSRLELHAEVALCLAATDNEAKAIETIRNLLFKHAPEERSASEKRQEGNSEEKADEDEEELNDLPADAPRLLCILGDLEDDPKHYERAWRLSQGRYARAQRSLGRWYVRHSNDNNKSREQKRETKKKKEKKKEKKKKGKRLDRERYYTAAAEAYCKSLAANRLDASTWFALGCVQLELEIFSEAIESFKRTVQIETEDAEGWSNLAAALMRLPEKNDEEEGQISRDREMDEKDENRSSLLETADTTTTTNETRNVTNHKVQALHALRQATRLKQSDRRIWENYLTVAASLIPKPSPSTIAIKNDSSTTAPWQEIIHAQSHLLDLAPATTSTRQAESVIDVAILGRLVNHVTTNYTYEGPNQRQQRHNGQARPSPHSLPTNLQDLMLGKIKTLAPTSARLWLLIAEVERWRGQVEAQVHALEVGWRAAVRDVKDANLDLDLDRTTTTSATTTARAERSATTTATAVAVANTANGTGTGTGTGNRNRNGGNDDYQDLDGSVNHSHNHQSSSSSSMEKSLNNNTDQLLSPPPPPPPPPPLLLTITRKLVNAYLDLGQINTGSEHEHQQTRKQQQQQSRFKARNAIRKAVQVLGQTETGKGLALEAQVKVGQGNGNGNVYGDGDDDGEDDDTTLNGEWQAMTRLIDQDENKEPRENQVEGGEDYGSRKKYK